MVDPKTLTDQNLDELISRVKERISVREQVAREQEADLRVLRVEREELMLERRRRNEE